MAHKHCEGTNVQGVPKTLQLEQFLCYCAVIKLLSGAIVGLVQETLCKCDSGVCGEPQGTPGASLELPMQSQH